MSLENPFRKKDAGPDWKTMSFEEKLEIEKQTLREEIESARAHADDLEQRFDEIAAARAELSPNLGDGRGQAAAV